MKKLILFSFLALSTLSGCVIEAYPSYYRCSGYYYVYSRETHGYVRVICNGGVHHRHRCH